MKKILTISAIATLVLLLMTSLLNIQNGFDLFMSSTPIHDGARVVLIGALVIALIVGRPRTKVLRVSFAFISGVVTVFAFTSAVSGSLQMFDTLGYILASVILMSESIELEERSSLASTKAHTNRATYS